MKILVGVCGFGQGHSNRQAKIIKSLEMKGHEVGVLAHDKSYEYFKKRGIQTFNVNIPWLKGSLTGLDYDDISKNPINQKSDFFSQNFKSIHHLMNAFGGFDLVISDYEPISAMVAYSEGLPFVTIDQQSKFLGYNFEDINGFSRMEERARLGLYFPRVDIRMATSFYKVSEATKDKLYDVEVVPTIIQDDVKLLSENNLSEDQSIYTVYLSPFAPFPMSKEQIVNVFKRFSKVKFNVFSASGNMQNDDNVNFFCFDRKNFLESIQNSKGVISTAGHTLLSELFYLKKPVYVCPFNTFDQNYCAKFISDNSLGISGDKIHAGMLEEFIDKNNIYKSNIYSCNKLFKDFNGDQVVLEKLEALYGV